MIRTATTGLLAALLLGTAASAQPSGPSQDRVSKLERAVADLQGAVYSVEGGRPAAPSVRIQAQGATDAASVIRLSEMEQEIARLTGRIEELTFRLASQQRQIDTIMSVMAGPEAAMPSEGGVEGGETAAPDADLGSQARALGMTPSRPAAPSGGPADLRGDAPVAQPVQVDIPADPDLAYEQAYEALLAGEYDRAEAGFEGYIDAFPEDVRAPEAKYLLGEIYLATGAYAEAAKLFLDHVRTYPDDPRAPEAYLKLGTAFSRLGKTDEACKVFKAGEAKFPDVAASVTAKRATEKQKAGC